MKLLSVAVPCYNSEAYMRKAIDSLLTGGDDVEILIVNDGSKDGTAEIAREYEELHPGIVRAIHKENGGHGDAVMTGLSEASGIYFKVVDSDDWVDPDAFRKVLAFLATRVDEDAQIDMHVSNFVYDKVGVKHKYVMAYRNNMPQGKVFTWDDTKRFRIGQYIIMHSVIYRAAMLRECGLTLPKHTFYVDELYIYVPLPHVKRMYYQDVTLYHYFIGRSDQSVHEDVMLRRMDQAIRVLMMLIDSIDIASVPNKRLRTYMYKYIEIVTVVDCVLIVKSNKAEHHAMRDELWAHIETSNPALYRRMRRLITGWVLHKRKRYLRWLVVLSYYVTKMRYGYN